MVSSLVYLAVVALLFDVFRAGGTALSRVALLIGAGGCIVGTVATLLLTAPLTAADQATAGSILLLYGQAYRGAILFFGCYCALLSVLAWRSRAVPRWIAMLLVLPAIAWLISGLGTFIAPAAIRPYAGMLIGFGGLGETALALWLTAFGTRRA